MHRTVEYKGPEGALMRVVLVIILAFLLILSFKKRLLNSLFKKSSHKRSYQNLKPSYSLRTRDVND